MHVLQTAQVPSKCSLCEACIVAMQANVLSSESAMVQDRNAQHVRVITMNAHMQTQRL
jgi:hypothetical protein